MGIKHYLSWVQTEFPDIFVAPRQEYDGVYFDMNGIVHDAARRGRDERHVLIRVYQRVDTALKSCTPVDKVVLALDGPAPLAKVRTQKTRRLKRSGSRKKAKFSPLQITPGTGFMARLGDALYYLACVRIQNNRKLRRVRFVVSGANVPGEGETKLLKHILRDAASSPGTRSALIVGADSDLILLGLATGNSNVHMLLKREQEEYCISVGALLEGFKAVLPAADPLRVRIDFILLSFMEGNDYLPKIRGCSIHRLWRRYCVVQAAARGRESWYLVRTDLTLNHAFLVELMQGMPSAVPTLGEASASAEEEEEEEEEEDEESASSEESDGGEAMDADDCFTDDDEVEGECIVYRPHPTPVAPAALSLENTQLPSLERQDGRRKQQTLAEDYLQGLLWCLSMYMAGECPDYDYCYPRRIAPTPTQMLQLGAEQLDRLRAPSNPAAAPCTPIECALMLLPSKAAAYLEGPVQRLVERHEGLRLIMDGPGLADKSALQTLLGSIASEWGPHDDQRCRGFGHDYCLMSSNTSVSFIPPRIPRGLATLRHPYNLATLVLASDGTVLDHKPPAAPPVSTRILRAPRPYPHTRPQAPARPRGLPIRASRPRHQPIQMHVAPRQSTMHQHSHHGPPPAPS